MKPPNKVNEKQRPFLGNLVGITSIILTLILIIAEVLFLRFIVAIVMSLILVISSIWAYRKSGTGLYELFALICILNILVLCVIILKESGIMPEINYKAVTLKQ